MQTKLGEWMWRFLAIVMMFSVGWTVWIIYQLNPPPLIMNAAFEAAAKAKGKYSPAEKQSSQGVIVPSGAAGVASAPTEAPAAAPKAPEVPKEPPVNPDKLKLTDTLAIPAPPGKK